MGAQKTQSFSSGMNGQSLNSSVLKRSWDVSLQREVQICVVGKVFRPNKSKILALNKTLSEYFKLVKWYLGYNSTSKTSLHEKCYEKAKELFDLNTTLIQTARDKAVEIIKSFEENRKEKSLLKLKRTSIRFDKRCYIFSKTDNALTPCWLTLSLNKKERISLPIVFGGKQKQRINRESFGRRMAIRDSQGKSCGGSKECCWGPLSSRQASSCARYAGKS